MCQLPQEGGRWGNLFHRDISSQKLLSLERSFCQRETSHSSYMFSVLGVYEKVVGLHPPAVLGVRPSCAHTHTSPTASQGLLWFPSHGTFLLPLSTKQSVIQRADYLLWVLLTVPEASQLVKVRKSHCVITIHSTHPLPLSLMLIGHNDYSPGWTTLHLQAISTARCLRRCSFTSRKSRLA